MLVFQICKKAKKLHFRCNGSKYDTYKVADYIRPIITLTLGVAALPTLSVWNTV